ncbi:MAG: response regulator [Acidobacteriota bacterium]
MNKRILIADDDRMTRKLLQAILNKAGYDVLIAEDGQAAVEIAASERPDLVLTDGLLPKLHGFLACKAIKEMDCPPKVIILTGVYTKPTYKWEAKKEYGADDVLLKPAKPDELIACIEKHLAAASEIEMPAFLTEEVATGEVALAS